MSPKTNFTDLNSNFKFFNQIANSLDEALVVVDKDLKVVYFNHSFDSIFSLETLILGIRFGENIKCKGHQEKYPAGICSNCKLRLSMLAAIKSSQNQKKETMVMEMGTESSEDTHLFQFQSNFMIFENEKYAVVSITDLTQMGNETLDFIKKFYS